MRILIYNWRDLKHPLAGGAEVYTDAVASEWVKMGHSVTLFCASVEYEPERELSAHGYEIVRRGSRHGVYREAKKYWRTEGKGNFDLVVDEVNTRPFFCSSFVKDAAVLVLVFQVAREVWFYEANIFVAILGRYVLEPLWLRRLRDTQVVTISESSKESLQSYGARNVEVVPVGCPKVAEIDFSKEQDPTFVFLGRLSANKRPGHVISAFEIVRRSIPNAKLWVIGDGPQGAELSRYGIPGVEFLGRLDDFEKMKRLGRAHLLLITSVREGWGMVVSEAAFLGTPSIGYDVSGLRDSLFVHGGLYVDCDPGSLASAVISFCTGELTLLPRNGLEEGGVQQWNKVAESLLQVSKATKRVDIKPMV